MNEWRRTPKGTEYYFMDGRDLTEDQLIKSLEKACTDIEKRQKVNFVADVTGAVVGPAYMAKVKALGKSVLNAHCAKQAVSGIDSMKRLLFGAFTKATGSPMKALSLSEAVEYFDRP